MKNTTRIALATLVVVALVQVATAQPSPGFSKTAPLSGTGTTTNPLKLDVCTNGLIYKSNGTAMVCAADGGGGGVSDGDKGDVTVSGGGVTWTIDPQAITLAKMANLATARIIGRTTAGTGDPEALTATQVTAMLDNFTTSTKGLAPLSGGGTTNFLRADGTWATPPGSGGVADGDKGDITVSGGGTTWTVDNDVVTYAKMQNVSATSRFLGRVTAGAGDPEEVTGTQATALLDLASTAATTKGLVPGSNGGGAGVFLNGSLGWTAETGDIAGVTTTAPLSGGCTTGTCALTTTFTTSRIAGRLTAGTGVIEELTGTQVTGMLDNFTTSTKGVVGASGGGTVNYLRADGSWAAPVRGPMTQISRTDTGTINDWAIGIVGDSSVVISSGSALTITGITGGAPDLQIVLTNRSTSTVSLLNYTGSIAANRFALHAATVVLPANLYCSVTLVYNTLDNAWVETAYQCPDFRVTSVATSGAATFGTGATITTGGLTISAGGMNIVSGNATIQQSLTVNDNTVLGNAAADTIVIVGEMDVNDNTGKISTKSASVMTLTSCGTGPTFTGDRTAGTVTTGTGTTACTINFTAAFASTPTCVVSAQPAAAKGFNYSPSTTRLDITAGAASTKYDFICVDHY